MKLDDKEPCPCGSGKLYADCHKAMLRTTTTVTNPSHLKLNVIPEPDPNTRTVLKKIQGTGTLIIDSPQGHYSLDCGACGTTLAIISNLQQATAIVLHCAACGEFNDTQVLTEII